MFEEGEEEEEGRTILGRQMEKEKKKGENFRIKIFFYVGILVSSETI